MCGIGPWHIRILTENSWEGGRQYTPEEVGLMTLDQMFMVLVDRNSLRGSGKMRKKKVPTEVVMGQADKEGYIRGVSGDGKPIKGKVTGKSLATRLREKAEAERKAKKSKEKKQRRRR